MPSYPFQLIHSAAHFMVTLTGTVRPPSIWKLKEFTELYSGVHNLRLCPEDRRLLVRALTNVLLLHWPGLNEQVGNNYYSTFPISQILQPDLLFELCTKESVLL